MSGSLKDLSAFPKDAKCPLQRAVDDRSNLGVDSIRGCLAIVVLAMRQEGIGSSKESPRLAVVGDASERLRHPVARAMLRAMSVTRRRSSAAPVEK